MPAGAETIDGDPRDGEFLAPLLQTLAESLDVAEIFARISAEAHRIVPHDFLMLGLFDEDHQRMRVVALSGHLPEMPSSVAIPVALRAALEERDAVRLSEMRIDPGENAIRGWLRLDADDARVPVELESQPLFRQLVEARGLHSFLRVAVRLRGEVLGGLVFCSTSSDAYGSGEVPRGRQVASCVALAIAHRRLAEEELRGAQARERAAQLEVRVRRLTEELDSQGRHRVLGHSKKWRDVLSQATKVSATETTVILSGESGTGKEVVARFIHRASGRSEGPFVALNCAALPEQLLESELFGHERGAFTGALSARPGKIELASGGVLFLDEIGEMSPSVQAKLLRVLQEREYERVGGVRTLRADIRVLAATHRDLKAEIAEGRFREDLYYRLAVFDISLPPLRERPEDIAPLVDAFLEELGRSMGAPSPGISSEARARLAAYRWPGNVRELRNAVERALILCEGGPITEAHLPLGIVSARRAAASVPDSRSSTSSSPPATLGATERELIREALARAGNNRSKAARLLGLTRAQLRARIEKHAITVED